ncbi:winged helix-turn-helix transcriptional regulator [Metabacillus rhizolycopersici]|uniref:Helix-turn-helix transcriptional regulator n=1 Tax=Metabacillus rhizolycopersici TaxID=2875709 RepID=A0ABS7UXG6_9BACI|nr:helix-turn-helix domain-containing protein [Metabacillus rhizolycopersici]MBZ5752742.1 helix-turn-helix transcriptional regulator [Metabacillus rhizolycopersici]
MKQSTICPRFEKAVSLLSQRWNALIIYQLLSCSGRFSTIQSSVGISGKVLSERLKDLEHQGIVKRNVIPETPVIIEYSLTEKGTSLKPILKEIENWSQFWVKLESKET